MSINKKGVFYAQDGLASWSTPGVIKIQ